MPHTLQEILLLEERALAVQAQKRRAEAAASEEKLLERRAERARRMLAEAAVSVPPSVSPSSTPAKTASPVAGPDQSAWQAAAAKLAARACTRTDSQDAGARTSSASPNESAARQARIAAFMETIRKDGWSAAFGDPERSAQYDLDQRAEWTEQVAQREAADRAAESERERLEVLADQIREAAGQAGR